MCKKIQNQEYTALSSASSRTCPGFYEQHSDLSALARLVSSRACQCSHDTIPSHLCLLEKPLAFERAIHISMSKCLFVDPSLIIFPTPPKTEEGRKEGRNGGRKRNQRKRAQAHALVGGATPQQDLPCCSGSASPAILSLHSWNGAQ